MSDHKRVGHITCHMQAPYKLLYMQTGFNAKHVHAGRSDSSLVWVLGFFKFSVLKRKCMMMIWSKQKLICEE